MVSKLESPRKTSPPIRKFIKLKAEGKTKLLKTSEEKIFRYGGLVEVLKKRITTPQGEIKIEVFNISGGTC